MFVIFGSSAVAFLITISAVTYREYSSSKNLEKNIGHAKGKTGHNRSANHSH